jgi:hypothetical protein
MSNSELTEMQLETIVAGQDKGNSKGNGKGKGHGPKPPKVLR